MQIAILGCGYVGLELGHHLADTNAVIGVRRSKSGLSAIRDAGFRGVQGDVLDPSTLETVPDVDALVFAASSGGRDATAAHRVYVEGQKRTIEHFGNRTDPPQRYVYTSSTGVYGDHGGAWVDESTPLEPETEKTQVLADAEDVAIREAKAKGMTPTVARLAGIYGPGRYRIERYLKGPIAPGYRNLVHRKDAAGALASLLELDDVEIVLVVDDEPVDRWAFSEWLAKACGQAVPEKQTIAERLEAKNLSERSKRRLLTDKRCSNTRLHSIGYEFRYPTFREGYQQAVAAYSGNQA